MPSAPSPLRRTAASVREHVVRDGWSATTLFVAHRLLERVSGGRARIVPYRIVAQPIGRGGHAVSDSRDTVVRRAAADDAMAPRLPRPAEVNARRRAAGAECHVAQVKGEFAGTIWIQRDRYDEDEVRCLYVLAQPALSVWDFDVYVEPRYRLGRTMARMWKAVDRTLGDEGVRWTFSRISLFNAASLKSHARLGAMPVATAVFVVAGPLQFAWINRRPWLHVSWSASRRPRIVLQPPDAGRTAPAAAR